MSDLISLGIAIGAHRRINGIRSEMRSQKLAFNENELSVVSMRQDIEKLYMIVEALWGIVKQATNLKDDDLAELVRQIDMQDGKLDGRNSENAEIKKCAHCGRTLLRGQTKCTYCGGDAAEAGVFRHNR